MHARAVIIRGNGSVYPSRSGELVRGAAVDISPTLAALAKARVYFYYFSVSALSDILH
jgi:hypothetical protein